MSELDLPDVNVLVALLHPGHVCHRSAGQWFAGTGRFATTPLTETGFLRAALNPQVAGEAISAASALAALRSVKADPRAEFLADASSLAEASPGRTIGLVGHKQVTDLHLVNLAAAARARLVTFDRRIRPVLIPDDQERVVVLS